MSEESYRIKYAHAIQSLGWAYIEGKSVDADINRAISLFLKAIEIDPPSLTAKQKQNLLYPLGFKEILLVVQSIKM